jgi:drug/metabolite transporter (DMT)-like permease
VKTLEKPEAGGPKIVAALIAVYLAWSSTYLVIKFALEGLPPLFMMGIRFFISGIGMYGYLRLKNRPAPAPNEWLWSFVISVFMLLGGSAGVAWAEQWVDSGLAALVIATTPLWTVIFASLWKQRTTKIEWLGLFVGFCGIVLLNFSGNLRINPAAGAALLFAAMSWAFGSAWSNHVRLPKGLMAGAAEMITGGALVMIVGFAMGERVTEIPPLKSVLAVVYLCIVGSLVGFTAYTYLLTRVRPALATSYAYVNPVLALLLGVWLGGERVGLIEISAMTVILAGVVLVVLGQKKGGRHQP